MRPAEIESRGWTPTTEEDKAKVRLQMNRLLATCHFKNSRRYPLLFRFIVEETLEGRGQYLKERLLGVRVFDRPADYDTAADPIVRVTIAEIRKRIAQYYHEERHDSEMRIELMPGHYEPEFRPSKEAGSEHYQAPARALLAEDEQILESAVVEAQPQSPAVSTVHSLRKFRFSRSVTIALGTGTALLILLGAGFLWKWTHPSALDELWGPLLANRQTVTFCLPVMSNSGEATAAAAGILVQDPASPPDHVNQPVAAFQKAPPNPTFLALEILGENIVFSDTLATVRISDYLAAHNRDSSLPPQHGYHAQRSAPRTGNPGRRPGQPMDASRARSAALSFRRHPSGEVLDYGYQEARDERLETRPEGSTFRRPARLRNHRPHPR